MPAQERHGVKAREAWPEAACSGVFAPVTVIPEALKNHIIQREMNNVETEGFYSFFKVLGLGGAVIPKNGAMTEASSAAGRGLPAIALSSWYISNMADSELSANKDQIAAIDARLNQISAQKAGCPVISGK